MKIINIKILILLIFWFGVITNSSFADDEKAYNQWSYNWFYIKTFTWWETHVISVPSLIVNDNSDHQIVIDEENSFFSIDWTKALPWKYYDKSETSEAFDFTPKILYKWPNCWVQTDQEIVNFIVNLRDSYNREPFISLPYYDEVFEDYDFLMTNFRDFDQLKKLWEKINKWLKCDLANFKTSAVFPVSCWNQDGTFEYIDDLTDINNTCLFTYEWSGNATVKDWVWSWSTKWLHISWIWNGGLWELNYKVFSYEPIKINFDYNYSVWSAPYNYSDLRFFIDDQEYFEKDRYSSWKNTYLSFESALLPPWLHEFKWVLYKYPGRFLEGYFDNILLTCIWWWVWCGWTDFTASWSDISNSLEKWDIAPWDIFDFTWTNKGIWNHVTWASNITNWTYAIKSPKIEPTNGTTDLILNKILTEPQKISFDIKTDLEIRSLVEFFINDIWYLVYTWNSNTDQKHEINTNANSWFETFTSPLLPAWDYEFKWVLTKRLWYKAHIFLDNINFSCIWWWAWCWWTNFSSSWSDEVNSIEEWATNPWDIFTFSWSVNIPWRHVSWWSNSSEWSYAIKSPSIHGSYSSVILNRTFAQPQKISFDIKTDMFLSTSNWSNIIFYVNWTKFVYYHDTSSSRLWYVNFESVLLPAGDYEFKWEIYRKQPYSAIMYLDNIKFTCIWWWVWCWWVTDFTPSNILEEWTSNLFDIFTFSSLFELQAWDLVDWASNLNWNVWSKVLYASSPAGMEWNKDLVLTKTFATPQKIEFDIKAFSARRADIYFWINGIEYIKHFPSSPNNNVWRHFESPLLPAGDYTFKWRLNSVGGWHYPHVSLDNIEFTCVWWWAWCWWTDFTSSWSNLVNPLEEWDTAPFDMFTFWWVMPLPWQFWTWTWTWTNSKALYINDRSVTWDKEISYTKEFFVPQKIEFDLKHNITYNSSNSDYYFYINWIEARVYKKNNPTNLVWDHYQSPLLPPWVYTFKWVAVQNWTSFTHAMWLDNIKFTCIWWWIWCWWTDFTASWATVEKNWLLPWDTNPSDIFTFTGALRYPWKMVAWGSNINWKDDGYSIQVDERNRTWNRDIVLENKTLTSPQKLRFDIKSNISTNDSRGYAAFYINWTQYLKISRNTPKWSDWDFHTFETPLLPAGDYDFKWRSYNRYTSTETKLWLDNIEFFCIWWWVWCWLEEWTLDKWTIAPFDMFTFTWSLSLPWHHVTWPWNTSWLSEDYTYALKVDHANITWNRDMVLEKTLATPKKIKFYVKTNLSTWDDYFRFYIDWVLYKTINNWQSWDGSFIPYESPLLPVGDYEFKWRSYKRYSSTTSEVWIDNIEFDI